MFEECSLTRMQLEEWEIFVEVRLLSLGTACLRVYSFQYIGSTVTIFHILKTITPVVNMVHPHLPQCSPQMFLWYYIKYLLKCC